MSDDIYVSVDAPEKAERLKEEFEEVIARVNGDLMCVTMRPGDPISVEAVIEFAERAIDHHLQTFAENAALQSLAPEIKQRFRASIELQARAAAGNR